MFFISSLARRFRRAAYCGGNHEQPVPVGSALADAVPLTGVPQPVSVNADPARRQDCRNDLTSAFRSSKIETLESRALLSAAPTLTGVELLGTEHQVSAVVLTFSAGLNPYTANDVNAFAFGKPLPNSSDNSGIDLGNIFFPFRVAPRVHSAQAHPRLVKKGKIQFASATYDALANTVTLTPYAPFSAQSYFRVLRIQGAGSHPLKDTAGNLFNAGADQVLSWKLRQGKTVRYVDRQHNRVVFKLKGPGKLYVFTRTSGDADPTLFIDSAKSNTVVTGTVDNPDVFNSTINIAQVEGPAASANNLLNNPSFKIQATTP